MDLDDRRTTNGYNFACASIGDSDQTAHSESSIDAIGIAKNQAFLHAVNKDADQTVWMRILI